MRSSSLLVVVLLSGCAQLLGISDPNGGSGPSDDQPPQDGSNTMPGDGSGSDMPPAVCDSPAPPPPKFNTPAGVPATGAEAFAIAVLDAGAPPTIIAATATDLVRIPLDGSGHPSSNLKLIPGQQEPADGVLLADMTGDGLVDVISWQDGGSQIEIRRRDPGSTGVVFFASPLVTAMPVGEQIDSVRLANLGGTAGPDLVVGMKSANTYVFRNTQQPLLNAGKLPGAACGAFDVDGDGRGDVLTNDGELTARFGDNNANFTPGTIDDSSACHAALAKLGAPHPVVFGGVTGANLVFIYRQPTPRTFTQARFFTGLTVARDHDLEIVDADGDGREDVFGDGQLVLACHTGPLGVAGEPDNSAIELTKVGHQSRLVDVDGDGKPDLVEISSGTIQVSIQQ